MPDGDQDPTQSQRGAVAPETVEHARCDAARTEDYSPLAHSTRDGASTPSDREYPPRGSLPRIPGYEVESEIARGGMGVVYRARHMLLNRPAAIKMILGGQYQDPVLWVRFSIEAEAVAALDHPNVVHVYEFGAFAQQPFFALEYVDGGTLAEKLKTTGKFAPRTAAELLVQIADGVAAAHAKGIVHRDLKPGNILLTGSLQPKIADFGLARIGQSDMTATGAVMGTPSYMSPEQASGRIRDVGTHSDLYALGAILFELLTGQPPFKGDSAIETIQHVLHREPERPRTLDRSIPRDLETITLKCLEKEPRNRYETVVELSADLRAFLEDRPIEARAMGPLERIWKWSQRRPTVAALVGVSFLAVGFLTALGIGSFYHFKLQAQEREVARERDEAEAARAEIARQKSLLEAQKTQLETQKAEVEQQKSLVEIERDRTRRIQYASDLNMADRAWQESHVDRMFSLLGRNAPQEGRPDLRGYEWYYLWQQGNWEEHRFKGARGARQMALAREARLAAVAGFGVTVDLWDLKTAKLKTTITADRLQGQSLRADDSVLSVAITPDGKTLAIGFHSGQLVAWDCERNRPIFSVRSGLPPRGYLGSVDVTADGKRVAACCSDTSVRIWDRDGKMLHDLKSHRESVAAVRFSPDGQRLASAGSDHSVIIWDAATGDRLQTLLGHTGYATSVDWSPDGTSIAGGSFNEEIRIWEVKSGSVNRVLRGHRGTVNEVAFRGDGKVLASCGADGTIRLWDATTGTLQRTLRGHADYVYSVDWNRDDSRIISSSGDGTTRAWNLAQTPEASIVDDRTAMNRSIAISPDGSKFATIQKGRAIVIRDSRSGKEISAFSPGPDECSRVAFHPDGKRIAIATMEGKVLLWNPSDVSFRVLTHHPFRVSGIAFSPDGSRLVTSSDDKTARIVDVMSGKLLHTLERHTNMIFDVAWSPDGKLIATGGHDYKLMLWNPDTGAHVREWEIFNFPWGMTFSPDSRTIALPARTVRGVDLHDVATGSILQSFHGHNDAISGIAFSPGGRRVFTSSWDRTVKIWDVVSGQQTLTLPSADRITALALHPHGTHILGVGDHTTTIWYAPVPGQRDPSK